MDVHIVQSGMFPNCHSVTTPEHDLIRIFRDPWDPRGLDSLIDAHAWADKEGYKVIEIESNTKDLFEQVTAGR
jgi:hypothetical protein